MNLIGKYCTHKDVKYRIIYPFTIQSGLLLAQPVGNFTGFLLPLPLEINNSSVDHSKGCTILKIDNIVLCKKIFPNNELFRKLHPNHSVVCDKFIEVEDGRY